jgi:hypothetical protein
MENVLDLLTSDIKLWESRLKDILDKEKRKKVVYFKFLLSMEEMILCESYGDCRECPVFLVKKMSCRDSKDFYSMVHLSKDTSNTEWIEPHLIKEFVIGYINFLRDVYNHFKDNI